MRRAITVPVSLAAAILLVAAPAAAGGPNSPVLITTVGVLASEDSGEPIQVDQGSWLLFRTGFGVTDAYAYVLDSWTIEIELDGEPLTVETVREDLGEVCDGPEGDVTCADAEQLIGYASSPPLSPGSVHTVTFRQTAGVAGEDGFWPGSWQAGDVVFQSTGTLVVGAP